ncbi:MAG: DUF945 domain-containing protein, partial [Proteobacteria bacterium]|nr:DUF945 domain-containing protein [Pseudomonadota bacterium]
SARYSFVPTLTAVDLLRDAGWLPIYAEQSAVRNVRRDGYQRHLIRFSKNGLSFGDERVGLVLFNSHDRGCAFKLIASVWRKWGAPHFRHYGERYKMVRDDSKPAKQGNRSSIHSPFYH